MYHEYYNIIYVKECIVNNILITCSLGLSHPPVNSTVLPANKLPKSVMFLSNNIIQVR